MLLRLCVCVCQSARAWFCSLIGPWVGRAVLFACFVCWLFVSLCVLFSLVSFVCLFLGVFVCVCEVVCAKLFDGAVCTLLSWWCMCLTCALACFLARWLTNSQVGPIWICLDNSANRCSHLEYLPVEAQSLKLGEVRFVRNRKAQQWHLWVQALQGQGGGL